MRLPGGVGQTSLRLFVIWIVRQDVSVSGLSIGVMSRLQLGLAERKSCSRHLRIERKRLPEFRNRRVVFALGKESVSKSKMRQSFLRILLFQMLKKCRRFIQHPELQKNSSKFLLIHDVLRIRGIRLLQRRNGLGILAFA